MNDELKISILASKVKRTSNITSWIFIIFMAYTFNQWHRVMGIDNFINVLLMLIIIGINVRFYIMYLNIADLTEKDRMRNLEQAYKEKKNEYHQQLSISLWAGLLLGAAKLFFH